MSRYSNSGTKANHAKLSFWSRQSIRQILLDQRMSFCLHPMNTPFCGDGVVQEGEVNLKYYFNIKVCVSFRSMCVCVRKQAPIPAGESQNVTNKSCCL